jgi:hypothetical protein
MNFNPRLVPHCPMSLPNTWLIKPAPEASHGNYSSISLPGRHHCVDNQGISN